MNMKPLTFDWGIFWGTLHDIAVFPLGSGFWNHIALVYVLILTIAIVGNVASKCGTDPDAPFDLG